MTARGFSCAAILDVHSSSVDGNYFIDPREEGGFEVECDMSNGGFTKVFHQDTVEGYLSNLAEAQSHQFNNTNCESLFYFGLSK